MKSKLYQTLNNSDNGKEFIVEVNQFQEQSPEMLKYF